MTTTLNRSLGCLAGLAVGDALGPMLEFTRPGSFEPLTDMIGGGPFQLKAGQWTDDTSVPICFSNPSEAFTAPLKVRAAPTRHRLASMPAATSAASCGH